MDVNATMRMIEEGIEEGDDEEAILSLIRDVFRWCLNGGFRPDWEKTPMATALLREWAHRPQRLPGHLMDLVDKWIEQGGTK